MKRLFAATVVTCTIFGLVHSPASLAGEPSKDWIGHYAIVYTKIDPDDWSDASRKAWEEKQEYDRQLFREGKLFAAGIFKDKQKGGQPGRP